MSIFQAFILGVVQGLTEFLPISSTAHLRVVPALLGWADPGIAFSAVIQLGSTIAVIVYFWPELASMTMESIKAMRQNNFGHQKVKLLMAILVGTVPICIIGLLLKQTLEQPNGPFRSLVLIAGASIGMGLLLALAEARAKHRRTIDTIAVKDGFLVGLGQAMALIPGCSRSGSTLTAAMFLDLKRDDAARFSFLLGIPAILLSGLLELKESLPFMHQAEWTSMTVGLISALIVSYASIAWLLKYLRHHSTWTFIAYRLAFGTMVLILAINHIIH